MSKSTARPARRTRVRRAPLLSLLALPVCTAPRNRPLTRHLGGVFKLELFLTDDYPMVPPKIRFLTQIYHPNVDKLGRICLDVLKSTWLPSPGPWGPGRLALGA